MEGKKRKINLTTWIFISMAAGLLVGLILKLWVPECAFRDEVLVDGIFYVIGNGFIRLMKMLVVPLVFCSLVCGIAANSDLKALGKTGVMSVCFYMITTAVAVVLAIVAAQLIRPGVGMDMSSVKADETMQTAQVSIKESILNIIPENPIAALANGEMLQVIVFAILVGILITKLGDKVETIKKIMMQANDIMMAMTELIMMFAPFGVFCMIARTFAGLGFDALLPLLEYVGTVVCGLTVHCFVFYMLLLVAFTKLNPLIFLKKFFPVMAFAFSTSTSNATIPLNIETLEEKIGVSRSISSFTIPLGATINMDGTSIMQGVAVCFAAQAYSMDLGISGYLTVIVTATLASVGTAGVPSVGLVTLSMVFASVGLPVEAIALIMGIDRIIDMMRTAVNITGDAVCTTIMAHMNGKLDRDVFYGRKEAEHQNLFEGDWQRN